MIRVGVLRGGTGIDYEQSLASGAYVLKHLPRDRYEVFDIYIDTEGVWHLGGTPVSADKLRHRVDLILNTLSGYFGADGKLSQLLESLGIPYTGSEPLVGALTMHRALLINHLANSGIATMRGVFIESWGDAENEQKEIDEITNTIAKKFSPPWVVAPLAVGHAHDSIIAKTRTNLNQVLGEMARAKIPVHVAEAVFGQEVSVVASSGFRRQNTYTFLPVEKKGSGYRKLKKEERDAVQKVAQAVHESLHCGPYSCTHAVVTPKGRIYVLSVETVPHFHGESELHHMFASVGSSFHEFSEHVIAHARARKS